MWKQNRVSLVRLASGPGGGPGCAPLNRDWVEAALTLRSRLGRSPNRCRLSAETKRTRRKVRLFHHTNGHRAGLPVRASLDTPQGSTQRLRAHRCGPMATLFFKTCSFPENSLLSRFCHDPPTHEPQTKDPRLPPDADDALRLLADAIRAPEACRKRAAARPNAAGRVRPAMLPRGSQTLRRCGARGERRAPRLRGRPRPVGGRAACAG